MNKNLKYFIAFAFFLLFWVYFLFLDVYDKIDYSIIKFGKFYHIVLDIVMLIYSTILATMNFLKWRQKPIKSRLDPWRVNKKNNKEVSEIEKALSSEEPDCPECGADLPHLCEDGSWLCDECRHRWKEEESSCGKKKCCGKHKKGERK
jgi:hypothetical protein